MAEKAIMTMNRTEIKYVLNPDQVAYMLKALEGHMVLDKYGLTTIASLYYDTPDYRLIRTSLEKPDFKEKIRLRSYGRANQDSVVYLELKRKSEGIVYKRRASTTIEETNRFFLGEDNIAGDGQIAKEISYFRDFYGGLVPSTMILYDRTAYYEPGGDLRLTIDYNPRYRKDDLDLTSPTTGKPLLPEGYAIMEVKIQESCPLWLSHILDKGHIYKGSFSKYGEAYKKELEEVTSKERTIQWKTSSKPYSLQAA